MNIEPNPRIVLIGSVGSSLRTLQGLLRHRMQVVGVMGLSQRKARNVSDYERLDEILAGSPIPYEDFEDINASSTVNKIRSWRPDLLFVVGLSQLVKQELLAIPRVGCVGFHPTRLPEGRGRAPVAWLILEQKSGAATFFLLNEGVDAGPILVQEPFEVCEQDDASSVVEKMKLAIDKALDRWLPELKAGRLEMVPQDETRATYYGRRTPSDGLIDWNWPASEIVRLVKATSRPHPGAYSYIKDCKLIIWKAEVANDCRYRGVVGRILEVNEGGCLVQAGTGVVRLTEYAFDGDAVPLTVGMSFLTRVTEEVMRLRQKVEALEVRIKDLESRLIQK